VTAAWPAILLAGGVAGLVGWVLARWSPRSLTRPNYSGRQVPVVLGLALVCGEVTSIPAILLSVPAGRLAAPLIVAVVSVSIVAILSVVGVLDDLYGGRARGLGGHVRSLLRGHPTTGILKLIVGVTASVSLGAHLADDPVRIAGIAVLVAVCINVWNALDVVPGRALKAAAVVLVPVVIAAWDRAGAPALSAALGGTLGLLPFDLRERGMLGDAGSNPLGFLVGLGLAVVLPVPALLTAAATALLLQVAAETVTISRLIEAVPPIRWFDRLGRRDD
jgi:UDP-GlcNAc:undecaprenyl-phosphate GlcNAc-1-phosphate transferase